MWFNFHYPILFLFACLNRMLTGHASLHTQLFFCDEAKKKPPNKNTRVYVHVCTHVRACVCSHVSELRENANTA